MGEISIFATFYILAQIVERFLEPFTDWSSPTERERESKKRERESKKRERESNSFKNNIQFYSGEIGYQKYEISYQKDRTLFNAVKLLFVDKALIKEYELRLKNRQSEYDEMLKKEGVQPGEIDEQMNLLVELTVELNRLRNRRAARLWVMASIFGALLCLLLDVGLISSVTALIDGGPKPNISQTTDCILTGVLVGSGTKPLHDLIAGIEKAGMK